MGTLEFSYTAEANGQRADAAVTALIHPQKEKANDPVVEPGDGFAKNDAATILIRRPGLLRADKDDANTKKMEPSPWPSTGKRVHRAKPYRLTTGR